jgi:fructose-1,6-bisphosphatase/inositol monophosphatase family enzyme
MIPNSDSVIQILRQTAAEEILPRFGRLRGDDISEKQPGDFVTTADVEAEKKLNQRLTALMPGSLAVGEEAVDADPGLLDALGGDDPVWIIDPVDGTNNFARGIACFAVIAAYCRGGETVAGWIHDPLNDVTVWAVKGKGAWSAGRQLQVAAPAPVNRMTGSLGNRLRRQMKARIEDGYGGGPARMVRYGCTGREYMDLALGKLHFAQYARKLKPWDHAAGVLIHGEAGGYSALSNGDAGFPPYRPGPGIINATLRMTPDRAGWQAFHDIVGDG